MLLLGFHLLRISIQIAAIFSDQLYVISVVADMKNGFSGLASWGTAYLFILDY